MGRGKAKFHTRPKDYKTYQQLVITLGDNTKVTFVGPTQLTSGAFLQDIDFSAAIPLKEADAKILRELIDHEDP